MHAKYYGHTGATFKVTAKTAYFFPDTLYMNSSQRMLIAMSICSKQQQKNRKISGALLLSAKQS